MTMAIPRGYVLPAQDPWRRPERVARGAPDASIYELNLLIGSRLEVAIARDSRDADLVALPAPDTAGVQPTSFEPSTHLIRQALVAARTLLASRGLGRHVRVAT